MRRRLSIISFIAILIAPALALGATVKESCAVYPGTLPYLSFGISSPSQTSPWKCEVLPGKKAPEGVIWIQGKKTLVFSTDEYSANGMRADMLGLDGKTQPYFTDIRAYAEILLNDANTVKKGTNLFTLAQEYRMNPKAILFSPNNARVAVYFNRGEQTVRHEKTTSQYARIFDKKNLKSFLNVGCFGCTPDEFFSLVINPVIQK
jgi:hypothetical protein